MTDLASLREAIDATEWMRRRQPITESAIAAFEERHGVRLPPAYRRFLLEVGNGVESDAMPLYGLDDAEKMIDPPLAAPFPYDDAYGNLIRRSLLNHGGKAFSEIMGRPEINDRQKHGIPSGTLVVGDAGGGVYSVLVIVGELEGRIWRSGDWDLPELPAMYGSPGQEWLDFDSWLPFWAKENGVKWPAKN